VWHKPNYPLSTGSTYAHNYEHILLAWRTNETLVFNLLEGIDGQCSGVISYPIVTQHAKNTESGEVLNNFEKPWQLVFHLLRNHMVPQMKIVEVCCGTAPAARAAAVLGLSSIHIDAPEIVAKEVVSHINQFPYSRASTTGE